MIRSILLVLLCTLSYLVKSQNTSVEKSIYGVQPGFMGIWAHAEYKISEQIALRAELGFNSGFWASSSFGFKYTIIPEITAEPRWYYNLNKRESKSKRTDGNSGNFLSLKSTYNPDLFLITNYDLERIVSFISVIPSWGIRRNIGNHFNYEAGLGIGYRYYFPEDPEKFGERNQVALNLHLRIGFRFN
ncbi:MAG TPA: hypothetical protein PKC24_08710 [Cyclobacteriaceae bacterium]|nr:hypothetical protein [Cyclobacteriaceae bacterium]